MEQRKPGQVCLLVYRDYNGERQVIEVFDEKQVADFAASKWSATLGREVSVIVRPYNPSAVIQEFKLDQQRRYIDYLQDH